MKKFLKEFGVLIAIIAFSGVMTIYAANVAYYRLDPGSTLIIDEFSNCKKITFSNTVGDAYFIPTKTSAEWNAFLNNIPLSVSSGSCIATFISVWDTTKTEFTSDPDNELLLPLVSTGTYNFTVDWGDGTSDVITSYNQAEVKHVYASPGVYTVKIDGVIDGINFSPAANTKSSTKLIDITNWGSLKLGNTGWYFYNTKNLNNISATDTPDLTGTTNLSYVFRESGISGGINNWDVSGVTNMEGAFYGISSSGPALDLWDTSSVTSMRTMFYYATLFNQPIGNWNTSNVVDMDFMFRGAQFFNQNINNWNTSSVTSMRETFRLAQLFNQPLNSWDTSSVTDMTLMFNGARDFNQNINNWNTSNVVSMNGMFWDATNFNQPLNSWDTSSVTLMSSMFMNTGFFNQPLNNWNTSSVTEMSSMFYFANSFNQDLSYWTVGQTTGCTDFKTLANSYVLPIPSFSACTP